ncbi:sulfurtransferase [Brevibacterium otitidis]|uniref:Sulfurtransferase n=1 Tax=Brevibacterium otitidis TaxID=53364 RepID=A0ABV5WZ48_9MICO|nr:sulfurtransferase [Brevibacterium otitidis]
MSRADHLITADRLAAERMSASPPVLLDVRWSLQQPDGSAEFAAGHIPGALYVSLDDDLTGVSDDARDGRHPLPSPTQFEQTVRGWGIDAATPVVVYDAGPGLGAARAWWLLRWAGVGNVRLLDGGYAAWTRADHEVEAGSAADAAAEVSASAFEIKPGQLPLTDADGIAELAESGTVIDARAEERYAGESEPMDPRAGHIPGALSAPATGNLSDGMFLEEDGLKQRFAALGIDVENGSGGEGGQEPVGVYCGSGVTACHNALALATLGVDAALYAPSWSGWSSDENRPAATGFEKPIDS